MAPLPYFWLSPDFEADFSSPRIHGSSLLFSCDTTAVQFIRKAIPTTRFYVLPQAIEQEPAETVPQDETDLGKFLTMHSAIQNLSVATAESDPSKLLR